MANGLSPHALRRRHRIALPAVCGLLVLAVALVFGRTVFHQFINCDDFTYVSHNADVKNGLTAQGIAWAFTSVYACNWHPLTWISHQLDWQIYGQWAGGHHLTNVLLHAVTAVLLLLVLVRMTGQLWLSAITAALFAVHPLRVESVAWVAERKDLLSGMLFMLTLGAYAGYAARPFSWGRYLAVVLLFALGLMAKPMLVTLPCVLLLLDYWPLQRFAVVPAGRLLLEKLPLFGLSAASCAMTLIAQTGAMVTNYPLPVRLRNALTACAAYLRQFVWPKGLAVLYPHPGDRLSVATILGSVLVLAGITAAAVAWRRKRPYLIVGWLWYLVMLLPVIGLVQVGRQAMADRYTYLPQIGVAVALVWGVADVCRDRLVGRKLLAFGAVALLLGLMAAAWLQTGFWRDAESLWRHTLACTADNFIAHLNLADALERQGRTDEAVAEYRQSLRIEPNFALTHFDLGTALVRAGKFPDAIACFQEALRLQPDYLDAQNHLANALRRVGRYEEAAAYYVKAMREGPQGAQACTNFGQMLFVQNKIDQAFAYFHKAIDRDPQYAPAYNSLGDAFMKLKRAAEAISCYQKAVELQPGSTAARTNLGIALVQTGKLGDAAAQFQQVAENKPDDATACRNLANVLSDLGEVERAKTYYQKAARLDRQRRAYHSP